VNPITVHLPADPAAPIKRSRPYLTRCGLSARLPSRTRTREDEDGPYLVAGPHPRYYRVCPDCGADGATWDGGVG
jgi:hypothetical protein